MKKKKQIPVLSSIVLIEEYYSMKSSEVKIYLTHMPTENI